MFKVFCLFLFKICSRNFQTTFQSRYSILHSRMFPEPNHFPPPCQHFDPSRCPLSIVSTPTHVLSLPLQPIFIPSDPGKITISLWYSSVWDDTVASHATLSKAKLLTTANIMWLFPPLWLIFQLLSPLLTPLQLWQWPQCSALHVPRNLMSPLHLLLPLPATPFPHRSFPHSIRSLSKHLSQWGLPSHPPPYQPPLLCFSPSCIITT